MPTPDVRELLHGFEGELSEVEGQLDRLRQRADSLRTTVEGLRGLVSLAPKTHQASELPLARHPLAAPDERGVVTFANPLEPRYVKPREAWLRLMKEQPRVWHLEEVQREMQRRGWLDPAMTRPTEAIRAAGRRLAEVEKLLERVGVAAYKPRVQSNGAANFALGAGLGVAAAALAKSVR